jgi:hypothetical protein
MDNETRERILREALFVPCDTMEQLHRWIKIYLGVDLPNVIICKEPTKYPASNSSPMHIIWEMYSKAREGTDPNFTQILGYSAREGMKTFSAAIIETLMMLHLKRNVAHVAALETQAKYCQGYVEKHFKRPILNEFIVSKNKRIIEIRRYEHSETGKIISPVQFEQLNQIEKNQYLESINSLQIIICTKDGANRYPCTFHGRGRIRLGRPHSY